MRWARPFKDKARPVETFELGRLFIMFIMAGGITMRPWLGPFKRPAAVSQGVDLRFIVESRATVTLATITE